MDKNILTLSGIINSVEKSHKSHEEQFYKIMLKIPRLSKNVDIIPIIISEKLLYNNEITPNMIVTINGKIRTKNYKENDKKRLLIFCYATDIQQIDENTLNNIKNKNLIELEGYICKTPIHRQTTSGRIITDLFIACNRQYSKSDYVPCIAWGINAKMAKNLNIGDKINLSGRFQSRTFVKKIDENIEQESVVYEVSVANLSVLLDAKNLATNE